ncbi:MAG TPA: alpha/beta fold hydrolase [Acidimicrobiales bacterium]|nr:alpha/beta fold hydrolase [Acidimicrobiales bacterium]
MPAPVIPGAEPFSHAGSRHAVLVLHGFTGNPQSMRPQADALAAEGYTVELPLLPGHGTAIEDMVPTRWPDYASAAEAAYAALAARCDDVAVVGLSMGGTLGCHLAERHPEIRGLVLVNPFVDPPAESFREVLRGLLDAGTEVAPGLGSDIAKEGPVELAYPGTPVAAALSLFEGIDAVAAGLAEIRCPVLLLSSRQDHVVPPSSGDVLVAGVSGPVERVWLEESFHVATLDNDAELVVSSTVAFVRGVLGASPAGEMVAGTAG